MRNVSGRFLAAVNGPHQVASRAILVDSAPQFGLHPTGMDIPIIDGRVTFQSLSDVHSTLSMTVPGDYWDELQPYGVEFFIERGVEFANGDRETVGLGYFRVEQVAQDNAPYGPISIQALDRTAQLQQNKLAFPLPLNNGDSHRAVFHRLFNGIPIPQQATYPGLSPAGYAAYPGARIPISWTSYNPDAITIIGDQIVEDDAYGYLRDLIKIYNASMMRFTFSGELLVYSIAIDASYPVYTLTGGAGGQIIKAKRTTKRTDVCNLVTAYGSDPTSITDFVITANNDPASRLAYGKTTYPSFGPAPTYYSSPLLQTNADVELAGETLLRRFRMLPETNTLTVIPNPALETNDVIDLIYRPGMDPVRCIIDSIILPLDSVSTGTITTRIPTATEGYGLGLGFLGP
jgi:uncharacterized protein DUF5047